jgi:hypothetical protein
MSLRDRLDELIPGLSIEEIQAAFNTSNPEERNAELNEIL